jgi:hypothetical protein
MQANVQFRYCAIEKDGSEFVLSVRALVDPGTRPVIDRRPEDCDPGSPAELLSIQVFGEHFRRLTEEQVDSRFGAGTWADIERESLVFDVELLDPH